MLDSIKSILNTYIGGVTRFNIYSIEMQRSENNEDLYYLCEIADKWYVVFETDYIGSLAFAVKEIEEVFDVKPLHWIQKGDDKTMPIDASLDTEGVREALVLTSKGSYLIQTVLAVEMPDEDRAPRYDPNTYGFTEG